MSIELVSSSVTLRHYLPVWEKSLIWHAQLKFVQVCLFDKVSNKSINSLRINDIFSVPIYFVSWFPCKYQISWKYQYVCPKCTNNGIAWRKDHMACTSFVFTVFFTCHIFHSQQVLKRIAFSKFSRHCIDVCQEKYVLSLLILFVSTVQCFSHSFYIFYILDEIFMPLRKKISRNISY